MTVSTDAPTTPQPQSDAWGRLADLIRTLIENRNASHAEAAAAKAQAADLLNIQQQDLDKVNQLIDIATAATPA